MVGVRQADIRPALGDLEQERCSSVDLEEAYGEGQLLGAEDLNSMTAKNSILLTT